MGLAHLRNNEEPNAAGAVSGEGVLANSPFGSKVPQVAAGSVSLRAGLSLPSSPAGHPEGKSGLERVRLDKRRGRNVGLT